MKTRAAKLVGVLLPVKLLFAFVISAFVIFNAGPAYSTNGVDEEPSSEESESEGDSGEEEPEEEESEPEEEPEGEDEGEGEGEGGDIELNSPPEHDDDDDDDRSGASSSDNGTSIFLRSKPRLNSIEARFKTTKKELSRLFLLSNAAIAVEFPNGGYDRALVQAANRARRAERAYKRNNG
ncbi:MAG: hypothetical protein V3V25_00555 [Paracoccaceae bacterium]